MAIEKISLLNVTFFHENTFDLLTKIKDTTAFHPQKATQLIKNTKDVQIMPDNQEYDQIRNRVNELAVKLNFTLEELPYHNETMDTKKVNAYLDEVESKIDKIEKVKMELEAEKEENETTLIILENMIGHEVDFDQLFNSHYIKVRVGRIPSQNIAKLEYYDGYPFILKVYKETTRYTWCAYIAVKKDILEIDNIFSSIGFERIYIPEFVHGTAQEAMEEVNIEIKAMNEYIAKMEQRLKVVREEHRLQMNQIYTKAIHLKNLYAIHDCIIDYSHSAAINGFVEADKLDSVRKEFEQIDGVNTLVLPENIYLDHQILPPVLLKNNKIIQPFEKFTTSMHYGMMDKTLLTALLWMLGMGIFFGDIGLGVILGVIGSCFMKKSSFAGVLNRIGVTMFGFGLLYGSSFYQTIYSPILHLNLALPLKLAYTFFIIVFGYWLIDCIAMMEQNAKTKQLMDVLLGIKGVSGLIVVASVLLIVIAHVQFGQNFLNLPLELVMAVAVILTIFKNKIKMIFGDKKTA